MVTEGSSQNREPGSREGARPVALFRGRAANPIPKRARSADRAYSGYRPPPPSGIVLRRLLSHDPLTERYGLGVALVPLGSRAADALGVAAMRPLLESLASTTGESVNLGVRDGGEVLVLLCVPSAQSLRFDQGAGTRVACIRLGNGEGPAGLRPRSRGGCPVRPAADQADSIDDHLPFGSDPCPEGNS